MRHAVRACFGAVLLLAASGVVRAQDDLLESVDDFLRRASTQLEVDWPLDGARLKPFFSQKVVYDDNIWQNDDHEGRHAGPLGDQNFTKGRVWDVSSETTARMDFIVPVNDKYIKLFERNWMTLLSYEATVVEYMRQGQTDRIDQRLYTDLFGFISDLMNAAGGLNHFYYEAGGSWSDISDPLDVQMRDLYSFQAAQRNELRRTEWNAFGKLGYRGNVVDGYVGYEFDRMKMHSSLFSQADHDTHTFTAEVGVTPEELGSDKRVYARYSYEAWRYLEKLLNNAAVQRGVGGIEGKIFSKKLRFLAEAGGVWWGTRYSASYTWDNGNVTDGEEMDSSRLGAAIARVELELRPWEELKETVFTFTGYRDPRWSAISNYCMDHSFYLSAAHEIVPRKLKGTVHFGWTHSDPSKGPIRSFFETGILLVYKLLPQVDLTFEYIFRRQESHNEVTSPGSPATGELSTDGDFDQNVISIGISVWF